MQQKSANAAMLVQVESKMDSRDMTRLLPHINLRTCNVQEGTGYWKAVKD
jgi:hypothetical protein